MVSVMNLFARSFRRVVILSLVTAIAAVSSQGQTFSTPSNISNNAGASVNPRLAVDGSGNINVVWQDLTHGNLEIFFSRSTDGGVSFSPSNISNNAGASVNPRLAVDGSGNINVLWQDSTPGNFDVFFSRSKGVSGAIQDLIDAVIDLNLKQGIENSLDAKLDAVIRVLDGVNQNNHVAAIKALQVFIDAVERQRGIDISDEDADALIAAAQALIALLGG